MIDETSRLEPVGVGSFGTVYKLNKRGWVHAVKIVSKYKMAGDQQIQEYIKSEYACMKALDHPNIVKLYEYQSDSGTHYFLMEYCNKGNLAQYIEKIDVQEEQLLDFLHQGIRGLLEVWSKKIVHRDIKPENLLLSKKNNEIHVTLLIGDFGISKMK